jgi:Holliday junction resolvase RusA-like endonuclease
MIALPLPPSTNNMFINAKNGKGRFLSPAYKAWRKSAAEALDICAWDMPAPPYGVTIRVNVNHQSDIDNRTKAVLDLLVEHKVLTGDQWVNALHVYRDRTIEGCTVEFFDPDCITIGAAANRVLSGLVVE